MQGITTAVELSARLCEPATAQHADLDPAAWQQLAMPALLISIIGFVESVSVARVRLAAKRRQAHRTDPRAVALGQAATWLPPSPWDFGDRGGLRGRS
ncbi:MAG: hypothetical protein U1F00_02350 [Rhodoferax sp.]